MPIVNIFTIIIYCYILICHIYNAERGYDSSTIQFSPKGRINQVDYAIEASRKGDPIIGIRCDEGIIIITASDMSNSRLNTNSLCVNPPLKVHSIDKHISIVVTGLLFDSLAVVDAARSIAASYRNKFSEGIPIESFSEQLSQLFHRQTMTSGSRPLGLTLLVAGIDQIFGSQIFSIDPDGSCYAWKAISLGKQSDKINNLLTTEIRNNWNYNISLDNNNGVSINHILRRLNSSIIKNYLLNKNTEDQDNDDKVIDWNIQIMTGKSKDKSEVIEWTKHNLKDILEFD